MDLLELSINVDGAARGNPGPAGIGAVIRAADGRDVAEISRFIGETTNNVAEYSALIAGLERALALGARRVRVMMDSELAVKQIQGAYRVKSEGLRPLFARVLMLKSGFASFVVEHVPRERNSGADALANRAIDAAIDAGRARRKS